MQESNPICPFSKKQASFDMKTSSSYCKSCQGAVIEHRKITYENEVNLHETDDQTKKQTRFGGYENKTDAFKNKLYNENNFMKSLNQVNIQYIPCQVLLDKMNHLQTMSFKKSTEVQNKGFQALAAIACHLTVQDRINLLNIWNSKQNVSILSKITIEQILKYSNVTPKQIEQVRRVVNFKGQCSSGADGVDQIMDAIKYQHKLPFSEDEPQAAQDIPENLMKNAIIKGEKTSTITCVIELMICQLSSNPGLNKKTLEEFTSLNDVTKDTVKKLWNTIIVNQSLDAIYHNGEGKNQKVNQNK